MNLSKINLLNYSFHFIFISGFQISFGVGIVIRNYGNYVTIQVHLKLINFIDLQTFNF